MILTNDIPPIPSTDKDWLIGWSRLERGKSEARYTFWDLKLNNVISSGSPVGLGRGAFKIKAASHILNFDMSDHTLDNAEKGERIDVQTKLAQEVYGTNIQTGEIDKFSLWTLKIRSWGARFGAEENGIERIPPEARTNQHPRGTSP